MQHFIFFLAAHAGVSMQVTRFIVASKRRTYPLHLGLGFIFSVPFYPGSRLYKIRLYL